MVEALVFMDRFTHILDKYLSVLYKDRYPAWGYTVNFDLRFSCEVRVIGNEDLKTNKGEFLFVLSGGTNGSTRTVITCN